MAKRSATRTSSKWQKKTSSSQSKGKGKRRGTIWSNVRWINPIRTGRGQGSTGLMAKLKYYQYRDDRNSPAQKGRQWEDRGLGQTYSQIHKNCQELQSDDRLAWTFVISPKPSLMQLVEDEEQRKTLLKTLTEDVMEDWFEGRNLDRPLYSYVLHDRATDMEGLQQLHTHIVLPGTAESIAGRERFDNNPENLRQFNTIVEDRFEHLMDKALGIEWRTRWSEIQKEEQIMKGILDQVAGVKLDEFQGEALPQEIRQTIQDSRAFAQTFRQENIALADIPTSVTSMSELNTWLQDSTLPATQQPEQLDQAQEPPDTHTDFDLDDWFSRN